MTLPAVVSFAPLHCFVAPACLAHQCLQETMSQTQCEIGNSDVSTCGPDNTSCTCIRRYAPANVQAAIDAQQNPEFEAPVPPTGGFTGGGMGGGMTGGMAGGMGGSQAMLQQSFAPSAPVAAAPASDGVFTGGNNAVNNRYTPSVGNAMGSSDLLVQVCEPVSRDRHTTTTTAAVAAAMMRLQQAGERPMLLEQHCTPQCCQQQPEAFLQQKVEVCHIILRVVSGVCGRCTPSAPNLTTRR